MKTIILALVFLLIGGALGGFLALGFGAGMGAAGGLVIGAQAGVCVAAETANEQGLADQEALEGLVTTAIAKIRAKTSAVPVEAGIEWVEGNEGCRKLLERFTQGPEGLAVQSGGAPR